MINLFKKIKDKNVIFVLFLTLLLTTISYMILPFLSIYFIKKEGVSISQAGFIIGSIALSSSIFAPYITRITRKFLPQYTISLGLITNGFVYIGFIYSNSFITCLILSVILGISSALINPILKTMLSMSKGNLDSNTVFRIRYMILCISIIIGPIIGNIISNISKNLLFFIPAILLFILSPLTMFLLWKYCNYYIPCSENDIKSSYHNTKMNLKLIFVTFIGVLVFVFFAVFESVTPIALNAHTNSASVIFSFLIILNSILALIIQPSMIVLNNKISTINIARLGCLFFALSYVIFCYANSTIFILILATIVFTIGEAMLIPSIDIIVDEISDDNEKNYSFAFSELKQLGFFISPVLGSYIIEKSTTGILYLLTFGLCVIVFIMYTLLKNFTNIITNSIDLTSNNS